MRDNEYTPLPLPPTASFSRFVHDDVLLLSLVNANGGDDPPASCFGIFDKERNAGQQGGPRFPVRVSVPVDFYLNGLFP